MTSQESNEGPPHSSYSLQQPPRPHSPQGLLLQPVSTYPPVPPPVPYQQFEYNFPTSFPEQLLPPDESSTANELFSASEHTNLLGFLDQFEWQFDPLLPSGVPAFTASEAQPLPPGNIASSSNAITPRVGSPTTSHLSGSVFMPPHQAYASGATAYPPPQPPTPNQPTSQKYGQYSPSSAASVPPKQEEPDDGPVDTPDDGGGERSTGGGNLMGGRPQKPVLSTPEKRVRHILSEQRRRNTIRDGYAALQGMLVAHTSAASRPVAPKPVRARGKGTRGRTRGKGKSGVLFRAVEYVKWLEESVEDLVAEVERLEAAVQPFQPGWRPQ